MYLSEWEDEGLGAAKKAKKKPSPFATYKPPLTRGGIQTFLPRRMPVLKAAPASTPVKPKKKPKGFMAQVVAKQKQRKATTVKQLVNGRVQTVTVTPEQKAAIRAERLATKPTTKPKKGKVWRFNVKTGQWYQKPKPGGGGIFGFVKKVVGGVGKAVGGAAKTVFKAGKGIVKFGLKTAPRLLPGGEVVRTAADLFTGGGGGGGFAPAPVMTTASPDGTPTEVYEGEPPTSAAGGIGALFTSPLGIGLLAAGLFLLTRPRPRGRR